MQAWDAFDRLPRITVPVLLLSGTDDRVIAPGPLIERYRDA